MAQQRSGPPSIDAPRVENVADAAAGRDAVCPSADGRPDERERFGFESGLLAFPWRLQRSAQQAGEPVDAGPDRVLEVRATVRGEESGANEVVESRLQMAQRCRLVGLRTGRMVGGRERSVEQARLGSRELEIGLSD